MYIHMYIPSLSEYPEPFSINQPSIHLDHSPLRPGASALLFQLDCPTALRSWHRVCGSGSPGKPLEKPGLEMIYHLTDTGTGIHTCGRHL